MTFCHLRGADISYFTFLFLAETYLSLPNQYTPMQTLPTNNMDVLLAINEDNPSHERVTAHTPSTNKLFLLLQSKYGLAKSH